MNGVLEYDGEWMEGCPIQESELGLKSTLLMGGNELLVSMAVEEIVIANNSYNEETITTLHFTSLFIRLKRIEIGSGCFNNVFDVGLYGLKSLESVKIDRDCFRLDDEDEDEDEDEDTYKLHEDASFRIVNCPNLRHLEIEWNSFYTYNQLELSNVNSLQTIKFGSICFGSAEKCVLKGK